MSFPHSRRRGESPTDALRIAACIRVYSDLPDGSPLILDVPPGHLTPDYIAQARAAGGVNVRVCALSPDGDVLDRVRVR